MTSFAADVSCPACDRPELARHADAPRFRCLSCGWNGTERQVLLHAMVSGHALEHDGDELYVHGRLDESDEEEDGP